MSIRKHGVLLCGLSLACIAGAVGFALGRVDTRAAKANDYEVFHPRYEAPAATEYARWYPTVRLLDEDQGSAPLLPTTGYDWETDPPAAGEEIDQGRARLRPDGNVLVLNPASRAEFEVWPNQAWPAGTAPLRCYPPVVPHHDHMGSMPVSGGAWPIEIEIERPTWEAITPALGDRLYHSGPVLLPDSRVLVPDHVPPRGTDPSPPSPPTGR